MSLKHVGDGSNPKLIHFIKNSNHYIHNSIKHNQDLSNHKKSKTNIGKTQQIEDKTLNLINFISVSVI